MSPAEILDADLADAAQDLRARQVPFAFATIVRTAGATAAKPGACDKNDPYIGPNGRCPAYD